MKKARAAMKGGTGNSNLVRLKADTTIKVRFLQEPEDWHEAWHHYIDQKFYWCPRRNCEHCDSGNRPRKAALANAVIMASPQDNQMGKVVVVQMPPSLADQVLKRHERFGTVLDRDYDLSREGSGLNDTKYSVDYDDRKKRDLTRWEDQIHDISAIVSSDMASGGDDEDEEPRSTKKPSSGKMKPSAKKKPRSYDFDDEEDEEEDDDFEEDDEEDYPRRAAKKTVARKPVVLKKPTVRAVRRAR